MTEFLIRHDSIIELNTQIAQGSYSCDKGLIIIRCKPKPCLAEPRETLSLFDNGLTDIDSLIFFLEPTLKRKSLLVYKILLHEGMDSLLETFPVFTIVRTCF